MPHSPGAAVRRPAPLRRLIGAASASLVGDGVRTVALPLYTAVSTHNPLAMSAVAAAEVLPWLLVAVPAGTLVDRWRPRVVLITCHWLRALLTGAFALTVFAGHATVPVLVAVAFLLTSGETFADSAFQSLLVASAGRDDLDRANGWYVTVETLGLDLAGPLLAGLLFSWRPGACFALDAATFLVAGLLVAVLPPLEPEDAPADTTDTPPTESDGGFARELLRGGRFLFGQRPLRVLVAAVVVAATAASAVNAIVPLYAVQTLGLRPGLVPTIWIAQALGTLLAARLVAPLVRRLGEGRVMVGALLLLGLALVLVGRPPGTWLIWVGYLLVGVGVGGWNVLSATRRQRLTPSPLMARVTSSYRMLAWGLMPLGAAVAGPLAEVTSLGTVVLVAGGFVLLVAIALARPLVRGD